MSAWLCSACRTGIIQPGHFWCGGNPCLDCGEYCALGPDDGPSCDGSRRQALLTSMLDTGIAGFFKRRGIAIDLRPTTAYSEADAAADSWFHATRGTPSAKFWSVKMGGDDTPFLCYISGTRRTGAIVVYTSADLYGHVFSLDGSPEHVDALIEECRGLGMAVAYPKVRYGEWPFGPAVHVASF